MFKSQKCQNILFRNIQKTFTTTFKNFSQNIRKVYFDFQFLTTMYAIVLTVERISSYKLVNNKIIKVMSQTQPVLSSQPHLER